MGVVGCAIPKDAGNPVVILARVRDNLGSKLEDNGADPASIAGGVGLTSGSFVMEEAGSQEPFAVVAC